MCIFVPFKKHFDRYIHQRSADIQAGRTPITQPPTGGVWFFLRGLMGVGLVVTWICMVPYPVYHTLLLYIILGGVVAYIGQLMRVISYSTSSILAHLLNLVFSGMFLL